MQADGSTVERRIDGVDVRDDPYSARESGKVLMVGTEWDERRWLDLARSGL